MRRILVSQIKNQHSVIIEFVQKKLVGYPENRLGGPDLRVHLISDKNARIMAQLMVLNSRKSGYIFRDKNGLFWPLLWDFWPVVCFNLARNNLQWPSPRKFPSAAATFIFADYKEPLRHHKMRQCINLNNISLQNKNI